MSNVSGKRQTKEIPEGSKIIGIKKSYSRGLKSIAFICQSQRFSSHTSNAIPIGIDLGTTSSCVAYWDPKKKEHKILPNTEGDDTTPSIVAFTVPKNKKAVEDFKSNRLVGKAAVYQIHRNATNTIYDIKRLIGRSITDEDVQREMKSWPFRVEGGEKCRPMIKCKFDGKDRQFMPEEITAMILEKLKVDADKHLNQNTIKCVITVPA